MRWPKISRPWNPAYQETFDAMTDREKQMSFLFDVVLVIAVLGTAAFLSGCSKVDQTPFNKNDPPRADYEAVTAYIDPDTGCQYLGYVSHGLTPRMIWDVKRQQMMQMGCRITEIPASP